MHGYLEAKQEIKCKEVLFKAVVGQMSTFLRKFL